MLLRSAAPRCCGHQAERGVRLPTRSPRRRPPAHPVVRPGAEGGPPPFGEKEAVPGGRSGRGRAGQAGRSWLPPGAALRGPKARPARKRRARGPLGLADLAVFAPVTVYARNRGKWERSTTCGPHAGLRHLRAESSPGCPICALCGLRSGLLEGELVLFKPEGAESRRGLRAEDPRARESRSPLSGVVAALAQ